MRIGAIKSSKRYPKAVLTGIALMAMVLAMPLVALADGLISFSWSPQPGHETLRFYFSGTEGGAKQLVAEVPAADGYATLPVSGASGAESFWAVTVVNTSGVESTFSEEARYVVDSGVSVSGSDPGPVNTPPTLEPTGNWSVEIGETLSLSLAGADADGDTLLYSSSTLPQGAALDSSSGQFSWTPIAGQGGSWTLTFSVNDGKASASRTSTITVTAPMAVNSPPTFNPIGSKSVNEGGLLSFSVSATDPDGDELTYSSSGLPQGASFNASGLFSWQTDYQDSGTYPATFTVTDGVALSSTSITISVNNVNRPPTINPLGPVAVAENQSLAFTITASDPDGDALQLSAGPLPANATFDPASGLFSWIPDYSQAGSYTINFTASDLAASVTTTVAITVTDSAEPTPTPGPEPVPEPVPEPNNPPLLATVPDQTVLAGDTLTFTLDATDPDGDLVYLSISALPANALLNTTTGDFTWSTTGEQAGVYDLVATASDLVDSVSQNFTITVEPSEQTPTDTITDVQDPVTVVTGDVTGDGITDVTVVDGTDQTVATYEGNAYGKFKLANEKNTGSRPVTAKYKKKDYASGGDLVVLTDEGAATAGAADGAALVTSVVIGSNISTAETSVPAYDPSDMGLGDFDHDGIIDAAVTRRLTNDVSIMLGTPEGRFVEVTALRTGTRPSALALEDFDLDGNVDIAITNEGGPGTSIYLGTGNGDFVFLNMIYSVDGPIDVAAHDFDLDGYADLAIANSRTGTFSIYFGNGTGAFAIAYEYPAGIEPVQIEAGEYNGDGFTDLAVLDWSDKKIRLFGGTGTGAFAERELIDAGTFPTSFSFADLDNDAVADLAVCDAGAGEVKLLRARDFTTAEVPTGPVTTSPTPSPAGEGGGGGGCFLDTLQGR